MFKLTVNKEQFGDFLGLFLYDMLLNENFYTENKDFNKLKVKFNNKGLKALLFDYYFKTDPAVRARYKAWKRKFESDSVAVFISNDLKEDTDIHNKIIKECVKRITKKENINKEKLKVFTESILNNIIGDNE